MRVWIALAAALGTLGPVTAGAADLYGRTGYDSVHPVRAPQLLIYDVEPGTEIRAYWAPPWQNRRYFPFTGKKPKVGRHEDLNAPRRIAAPAPTYYQEWSTLSLYPPRGMMPYADVEPPFVPVLPPK